MVSSYVGKMGKYDGNKDRWMKEKCENPQSYQRLFPSVKKNVDLVVFAFTKSLVVVV